MGAYILKRLISAVPVLLGMMILAFAVNLRLLPVSGMYTICGGGNLPDLLILLLMPATALAVVATGVIARLSRSAMLEVLQQDYIHTARAKGVDERRVIMGHAPRAAMVNIPFFARNIRGVTAGNARRASARSSPA